MTSVTQTEWVPGWATHPGEHLAEYIETNGWSQAEFARLADLTPKHLNTILKGTNPVTPETAIKLERVLGLGAQVWTNLQNSWDLHQARKRAKEAVPDTEEWLRHFPVRELKARKVLPDTKDVGELADALMHFLKIGARSAFAARVTTLAVHHRQSKRVESSPHHIFAWLMLGEHAARSTDLPSYDKEVFLAAVSEIRSLTIEPPEIFEPRMIELCRKAGVALVFEKPISKTCLFGSARWLDPDRAIIQMSLRMKSNDHFWWTFFHEAAHLVLHRGRNFADDQGAESDGVEQEADAWAEEVLVGRQRFAAFVASYPRAEAEIRAFAEECGIHPGIVVGMLQHRGVLPWTHLNKIKVTFEWASREQ
jgi:HTH-type transcriptional regulator/antitoxin HigA